MSWKIEYYKKSGRWVYFLSVNSIVISTRKFRAKIRFPTISNLPRFHKIFCTLGIISRDDSNCRQSLGDDLLCVPLDMVQL